MMRISSHCLLILSLILVVNVLGTASDLACEHRGGTCQYDGNTCPGGYRSGLCNGGVRRRCCLRHNGDYRCTREGGRCQNDYLFCWGGYYLSGLCAGPSYRRCCVRWLNVKI